MKKRKKSPDDFDSPWKDALQLYFAPFLALFFPDLHADIDWSRGYLALDKEFQQIIRRAKVGKGLADKLFKVWLRDGSECWLVIHVEVQGNCDPMFPERMFRYNVAAFSVYNQEVLSLAVLCDENPNWRPTTFHYGRRGCRTGIEFLVAKLLDHASNTAKLEKSDNPFAAIVLAHLEALATQKKYQDRRQRKLRLVKGLYQRNWTPDDVRQLFRLIDWIMDLPDDLAEAFRQEVYTYEEEKHMPYVTSIERLARQEGLREGEHKGMCQMIAVALEAKFGQRGLKLMRKIQGIQEAKALRELARAINIAKTLDEVRDELPED